MWQCASQASGGSLNPGVFVSGSGPGIVGFSMKQIAFAHFWGPEPSRKNAIGLLLEHDPEKCVAVFRKDHAQLKGLERDARSRSSSSRSPQIAGAAPAVRRARAPAMRRPSRG